MSCCVQEEKILFLHLFVRNENCQESTITVVAFHFYCLKLTKSTKVSLSYTGKASLSEEQEIPKGQMSGFRRGVDEVFALCVVTQCIW
jgi:hypothetical protein